MSSKFRNLKIKPRLNVSRSQVKAQVIIIELCNFMKKIYFLTILKIIQESSEELKKDPEDVKVDPVETKTVPDEPEKILSPPSNVDLVPRKKTTDTSAESSNKFRKPKPAPRLNVSRSAQKLPVS